MRTAIATSALLVVAILASAGLALAGPDPATAALGYLANQQAANGSIAASAGVTEDVILGTAAANFDPNTLISCAGTSAFQYLAAPANLTTETATAGGTGKLILAVLAGKLDPTAFGGRDLIARLGTFLHGTTGAYGDGSTFGQSLAILALKGAGLAIPVAAVTELEGLQDTDGSWNYQATNNSTTGDTNSTAIAVEALLGAGVARSDGSMLRVIAYLHTQQTSAGGFTFSAPGLSDPDSDAVVIQALAAFGQDPSGTSWTVGGKTVFDDLSADQAPNGGFTFPGHAAPDPFTTSEVPAGLRQVPLPGITTWAPGAKIPRMNCPAPTPTGTHRPAVTPPTTSTTGISVGGGDGGPIVPVVAGLLALAVLVGRSTVGRRSSRSRR